MLQMNLPELVYMPFVRRFFFFMFDSIEELTGFQMCVFTEKQTEITTAVSCFCFIFVDVVKSEQCDN